MSLSSHSAGARAFFTPRWMITTLLVIAAVAGMARLGFWQLDRLEQRRAFNAAVQAQITAPPLDLNSAPAAGLEGMEYRPAVVRGTYDPQNEIVQRNQVYQNQPGYHLLTPLRIAGREEAVLVDRGFIPMDQAQPASRAAFAQPGEVTLQGVLRLGHVPRVFGVPDPTLAPGETRLDAWNAVDLDRIRQQAPYPLLPVVLELIPLPGQSTGQAVTFPVPSYTPPDITEGSHLGYAFQWFSFAALLAVGYPIFVRKQIRGKPGLPRQKDLRQPEVVEQEFPQPLNAHKNGARKDSHPLAGPQLHGKKDQ